MKEWLKAGDFADWLVEEAGEETVNRARAFDPSFSRRLFAWRNSPTRGTVSVYTVDEILTRVFPDLDFRMIPDHLYCDRSARRSQYTERERQQAVSLSGDGWTPTEISKELGCSIDIIHRWRKAAKAAA